MISKFDGLLNDSEYLKWRKKKDELEILSSDIIEFPLKKYMSVINEKLEEINIGKNNYFFDFLNEKYFKISFNLIIQYNISNKNNIEGSINKHEIKRKDFKNFNLTIEINSNNIDKPYLLSVIMHELKHIFDLYYENNTKRFDLIDVYHDFKEKYNDEYIDYFLEVLYLSLECEMDARNSMIYNRLKWLNTFDKSQILSEFKNTYTYKALDILKNFDVSFVLKSKDILEFTNEFIEKFLKENRFITITELKQFYTNYKTIFIEISKKYLKEAEEIIDDLIKDIKPYMEVYNYKSKFYSCLTGKNIIDNEFVEDIINEFKKYDHPTIL